MQGRMLLVRGRFASLSLARCDHFHGMDHSQTHHAFRGASAAVTEALASDELYKARR